MGHGKRNSKKQTNKIISNNLTYHAKEIEKEEQIKSKVNKKKEIIKITLFH